MHALVRKSYVKQQQLQRSISGKGKPVSSLFPYFVVQAAGMSPAPPPLGESLLGESEARMLESLLDESAARPQLAMKMSSCPFARRLQSP